MEGFRFVAEITVKETLAANNTSQRIFDEYRFIEAETKYAVTHDIVLSTFET